MASSPSTAPTRGLFDGMAIGLSGLCLLHCLALPVLLTLLPSLSIADAWPEELHIIAATMAAIACVAAILPRWSTFSAQKKRAVGIPAAIGLACLLGGTLAPTELWETGITVAGSLMLILAHIRNLRSLKP